MSHACFSLSVDDGHPLDLRIAELLDRHGLQATFYLPIENCEGPPVLDGAQMRVLAQRFEIGSHTLSHRFLTTLDGEAARRQIIDGKRVLEDRLGQPVRGFCYPGGRYRRLHRQQVADAGFDYARTTQNLRIDADSPAFEMPTTAQFYPHPRQVVARNFVSQRHWARRWPALRVALREEDWQSRLHRLLDLALERSGVFHLWCHAIDIERLQLWDALGHFLARAAREFAPAQRLANGQLLSQRPAVQRPAVTAARAPRPGPPRAGQ